MSDAAQQIESTISDVIYKLDSQGRLRTWQYELQGAAYRTIAGLADGKKVVSEWTHCTPKSCPSAEGQAAFEAEAMMRHKLERTYHATPDVCSMPNFFEPMLAKDYAKTKTVLFPVYEQPKLDGIRCIARAEGLFSRQGKPITSCPHIEEALAPLFADDPDLILDGELYNHELKADFEKIVSIVRKQKPTPADIAEAAKLIQYHVYDAPSVEGPFLRRSIAIVEMIPGREEPEVLVGSSASLPVRQFGPIIVVETRMALNQDQLDADYAEFMEAGYEGQMVRLDEAYEQKRSKHLLKRKDFLDAEFEISAIGEGLGNWSGKAKFVEFILPGDKRLENGERPKAGISGTQAFCAELWEKRTEWVGKQVTVKYFTPTGAGIPRFPVAIKFHESEKL